MPNCEGIFKMVRFDGVELFDGDTVCLGTEVSFYDQSTTPNGNMVNWEWSIENTEFFTQDAVYSFTQPGTTDIMLWADDANNCFADLELSLHVIDPPTFTYSTEPTNCVGSCDGVAQVVILSGSAPMYDASWDDPLGSHGLDAYSLCAGSYNAIVKDNYGCSVAASAGVEAVVGSEPALVATVVQGPVAFTCPGSTPTFVVDVQGGVAPTGYWITWQEGVGFDNPSSATTMFVANEFNLNQTYTVTVIDDNNCQTTADVTINATPSSVTGEVTIGGDPCVGCTVEILVFDPLPSWWQPLGTPATTGSTGAYDLGLVPGLTAFSLVARPDQTLYPGAISSYYLGGGQYTHSWAVAGDNPLDSDCAASIVKNFEIIEPAVLDGSCTISGGVYQQTTGKTLDTDPIPLIDVVVEKTPPGNAITSTITDDPSGLYEFNNLPLLQDGEVYKFYVDIPGVPGTFNYQIGVAGPDLVFEHIDFCLRFDSTAIEACTVLGIEQPIADEQGMLMVYPNPSNGQFSIAMGTMKGETAIIEVLDMAGRKVWERSMNELPNLMLVSGIAPGSYVVRLSSDTAVRSARLNITE